MKKSILVFAIVLLVIGCGSSGKTGNTPGAEKTNANLASLTISSGSLTFAPDTVSYSVEVTNSVSLVTIIATTNQSKATLRINGIEANSGSPFNTGNLNVGQNIIQIVVTSSNGSVNKTYSIVVTRLAPTLSNNANLSSITLSAGSLSPGFGENITAYNVQVSWETSSISLRPIIAGVNASININGTSVGSGENSQPLNLNVGPNTIYVVTTAEDGVTTKTYTISVTRISEPSHNANLANLTVSQGILAPGFNENTIEYTIQVQYEIGTITATPTSANPNSSIKINGIDTNSNEPSQAIPLSVGENAITILLTAQDGTTTKAYSIVVNRLKELSHNADLADLTSSSGTLSPGFNANNLNYTVQVTYDIAYISVTPTSAGVNSSVQVNDSDVISGTASPLIPIIEGENPITIKVYAEDGIISKTYEIVVTRLAEPSHDANLANLTISTGELSPTFDVNTYNYYVVFPYNTKLFTLTPTCSGVNASILVNNVPIVSGTASQIIDLNIGDNIVTIQIIAEDGSTVNYYYVIVTRLGVVLEKIDDAFWGESSIVYDPATGLDWLTPINTVNLSFNTVISYLGIGGYHNFRYATLDELNTLLVDANLTGGDYEWRFRATAFVNLFQPTYSGAVIIYSYIGVSGMFMAADETVTYFNVQGPLEGDLFAGVESGPLPDKEWLSPNTGSWLVRPHVYNP